LNAIAALVRADPRTAESMLVKLSDLLRLTLDGGAGGSLLETKWNGSSCMSPCKRCDSGPVSR
jgi:hypothetical protein